MRRCRLASAFLPGRRLCAAASRAARSQIKWVRRSPVVALLLGCLLFPFSLRAQSLAACPAVPLPSGSSSENLLSPKQEAQFGRIVAAEVEWNDRPFSGTAIATYPDAVLGRLLKGVPGSADLHPQIRFFNTSFPDAFAVVGGHIYVSRQIAPFLHNESELAALLAHEMGHVLSHQSAIEFSHAARKLLGIRSFSGNRSVLEAYSRLTDRMSADLGLERKWAHAQEKRNLQLQETADRIALYLLARAGYPPQAMATLFNRLAQTHGNTGNWFTDLFRIAPTDQRRLRALENSLGRMPAACRRQKPPATLGDFSAWRNALISFEPPAGPMFLSGQTGRGRLQPGLPGPIGRIRFSRDGRYLLVHDAGGVLVFTTNPLKPVFRISAPNAADTGFSPDSHSVIFHTNGLRVERWNIASLKRTSLHLAVPFDRCWVEADSPDGQFVAVMGCTGNLSILRVDTGGTVFSAKGNGRDHWNPLSGFSPDSGYFVAVREHDDRDGNSVKSTIAVDLRRDAEVSLPSQLDGLIAKGRSLVFLDASRLAILSGLRAPDRLFVLGFPSGKVLENIDIAHPIKPSPIRSGLPKEIGAVTGGADDLALFPFRGFPAALLDVTHGKLLAQFHSPVFDVFGQTVAFRQRGRLFLTDLATSRIQAATDLPPGLLGPLTAAAVSPDLKWLAISGPQEGGVFRLSDGKVMDETPQFSNAWFGAANSLYLTFPSQSSLRSEGQPANSTIRRVNLEKSAPPFQTPAGAGEDEYGPFLVMSNSPAGKNGYSGVFSFEVHSLESNQLLWTRKLPSPAPPVRLQPDGKTLLLGWPLLGKIRIGRLVIEGTSKERQKLFGVGEKDSGYGFQALDGATGKVLGQMFLPGLRVGIRMESAFATPEALIVSDAADRTRVFSWKTKHLQGLALGRALAVSPDGRLACVAQSPRLLEIALLPSLRFTATLQFPQPVSLVRFSRAGRRLFVLTRDQRYFFFDVPTLVRRPGKPSAE
jgi:hypothetical protein